jgi:hypothetical protein
MSVAGYLASGRAERDWEEVLRLALRGKDAARKVEERDGAGRYRAREEYDAVLRAHCGLGERMRLSSKREP